MILRIRRHYLEHEDIDPEDKQEYRYFIGPGMNFGSTTDTPCESTGKKFSFFIQSISKL